MTKQQLLATLAKHNITDLSQTTIGTKYVTTTYHVYIGNHPNGRDTGDDMSAIAGVASYNDNATSVRRDSSNGFTRRTTVKMTFAQVVEALKFHEAYLDTAKFSE